jgi:hypothetical protein
MLNKLWEISIISLKIIKNKYIFLKTRAKRTLKKKKRERERENGLTTPKKNFEWFNHPKTVDGSGPATFLRQRCGLHHRNNKWGN